MSLNEVTNVYDMIYRHKPDSSVCNSEYLQTHAPIYTWIQSNLNIPNIILKIHVSKPEQTATIYN